ncbi:MAG: ribonuclease T2 [Pseudomonadota bacterium]
MLWGPAVAEPHHYVLALSWSPTYCEDKGPRREPLQCALHADHTFIVHGLWPNARDGSVNFCDTDAPPPSRRTMGDMLDIMPSESLVRHQWRKHGTCSGLSGDAYFETVRRARGKVSVPPGLATLQDTIRVRPQILREAFLRANADLSPDDIYVRCKGNDLVEVRICMTPNLDFRACPKVENRRCRAPMLEVDPPR